jgi:hypothetical protein
MKSALRALDELLRGKRTGPELIDADSRVLSLRTFVPLLLILGAIYGFFMGWFALFQATDAPLLQTLASTVKLPLLFVLTLAVTLPSLYVFNALMGSRLGIMAVLRLLVAAVTVSLAIAASLGPILGFFTVSADSYRFIVLLNVVLLGLAGVIGLAFLLGVLRRLAMSASPVAAPPLPPDAESAARTHLHRELPPPADEAPALPPPAPPPPAPPPRAYTDPGVTRADAVFKVWVIIYGLVGVQMAWLLRPFIGHPDKDFTFFRERSGSFFEAIYRIVSGMLGS